MTQVKDSFSTAELRIKDASQTNEYIFVPSELAADRNITIPLLSANDELVLLNHPQTLTNKTITDDTNSIKTSYLKSATTSIDIFSAPAPTAGQVLTATNSTTATWQSSITASFENTSSDTVSATTSNSFIQKIRLTTSNLANADYHIGWSFEIKSKKGEVRVEHNDTTQIGYTYAQKDDYIEYSGFINMTLSGVNTFDIDYRAVEYDINIRRARIELWKIS